MKIPAKVESTLVTMKSLSQGNAKIFQRVQKCAKKKFPTCQKELAKMGQNWAKKWSPNPQGLKSKLKDPKIGLNITKIVQKGTKLC